MANITTTFNLIDNVSPQLRNITNNIGGLNGKLINLSSAMYVFDTLERMITRVSSAVNEYTDAFANQYEQEQKLYTIMKQRMDVTNDEFQAMLNYARQIQANGVLSDQVILKGTQELASFVQTRDEIERLIPAIANLTVQQYGYNASADQMRQITTSIGKMLNGTVSGLSKLGLAFTDAEKKMLKSNDMAKKVEIVYQRIADKVGNMNEAMAQTNIGRIANLKNQIQDVNEQLGYMMQPLKIVGLEIKLAFQTFTLKTFSAMLKSVSENTVILTSVIGALATAIGVVLVTKIIQATVAFVTSMIMINPWLILIQGILVAIGALAGAGIGGKVKKLLKDSTSGFQTGWGDVAKAADGSILVTDKSLVDIAEDYRELLSRRAIERFNLQMAQGPGEVKVVVENVQISKEADVDDVLDKVVVALEDFSSSSLTGLGKGGGGKGAW